MTKEQEAQQAETDAAIIKKVIQAYRATLAENANNEKFDRVLALVDSQAQKIAEQEEIIKALRSVHDMKSEIEEVQKRIRETL